MRLAIVAGARSRESLQPSTRRGARRSAARPSRHTIRTTVRCRGDRRRACAVTRGSSARSLRPGPGHRRRFPPVGGRRLDRPAGGSEYIAAENERDGPRATWKLALLTADRLPPATHIHDEEIACHAGPREATKPGRAKIRGRALRGVVNIFAWPSVNRRPSGRAVLEVPEDVNAARPLVADELQGLALGRHSPGRFGSHNRHYVVLKTGPEGGAPG